MQCHWHFWQMISRNSFLVLVSVNCLMYAHPEVLHKADGNELFASNIFLELKTSACLQRVLQFDYKLSLPQAMFLYRKKRSWPSSVSVARQLKTNSFFFLREQKDLRNSKSGSQYLDSSRRVPSSSLSHASIYDRNAIWNSYPFILVRLEVS